MVRQSEAPASWLTKERKVLRSNLGLDVRYFIQIFVAQNPSAEAFSSMECYTSAQTAGLVKGWRSAVGADGDPVYVISVQECWFDRNTTKVVARIQKKS